MEKEIKKSKARKYINPYLGGILLGITVLMANYISGRGLGASGAMKNAIIATVDVVAPAHAENTLFYKEYHETHEGNPLNSWLVYQMLGVVAGGFLSGVISRRLTWKVEHSPKITSRTRLIAALLGGILFGFGSQLGRGCTSGSALSGMAVLSLGGFISMMAIFGTAFVLAFFVKKLWI